MSLNYGDIVQRSDLHRTLSYQTRVAFECLCRQYLQIDTMFGVVLAGLQMCVAHRLV